MQTQDSQIAAGLSNVVCKDGQQICTAQVPFALGVAVNAGSTSAPGLAIVGDLTTGLYQSASASLDVVAAGTRVGGFNAGGLDNTVIGAGTPLAGSFTTLSATSSINKVTITAPVSSATLTIANGKIFKIDNTLEFAGTDSTVMTFPVSSGTVTTLAGAQTLTNKTLTSPTLTTPVVASLVNTGTLTLPTASSTLLGVIASTLAQTGYFQLTDGLIVQWGITGNIVSSGTSTITLPLTFPNTFFTAYVSRATKDTSGSPSSADSGVIVSTSQLTVNNNSGSTTTMFWLAIGN